MRARLLAVATELFAERGFHGTSLAAVADAVGIKKPSLLYHFPSKEALRQAVLEAMLDHWRADIAGVLARSRGRDQLTGILAGMIHYFQETPQRARLLLREALDNPEGLKALFHEHLKPWTGLLTEHIRRGQARALVRAEANPEAFVLQMIVLGVGSVALADLGDAIVPGAAEPRDANLTEILRIAQTALYHSRAEHLPEE
jgi:AcrR family transcriptional regulator